MRNHNVLTMMTVLLTSAIFGSCAVTHVPPGWLPDPDDAATSVYGGWVEIRTREARFSGELVAITGDTVFVAGTSLHAVCSTDILSARLVTYDAKDLGGYVLLGTVSTISNGWFLVLTAPMWLIGGSIAASCRTYEPIMDFPAEPLMHFVPYARYPQGLPPDIDRAAIRMKGSD